jgi:hypothetical protein
LTGISTPPQPTAPQGGADPWSPRSLIAAHKRGSVVAVTLLAVLVAMFLVTVLGPQGAAVTSSTSCSSWGSTNQLQQQAYANLYLREHGPVSHGGSNVASVVAAINSGCTAAFNFDDEDTVSVVQAINGQH